jgi:hypothetical protein
MELDVESLDGDLDGWMWKALQIQWGHDLKRHAGMHLMNYHAYAHNPTAVIDTATILLQNYTSKGGAVEQHTTQLIGTSIGEWRMYTRYGDKTCPLSGRHLVMLMSSGQW